MTEIKNDIAQGEMVPIEDAVRTMVSMVTVLRTRLLALPTNAADRVPRDVQSLFCAKPAARTSLIRLHAASRWR